MEENRKNPRGRGSKYEDRKAQAELMWADRFEMTIPEIAKKYKVSVRTVRNRLDEFPKENYERSLVKTQPEEHEVSPAQLSESARMWEDRMNGMTHAQLAKKYEERQTVSFINGILGSFVKQELTVEDNK